MKLKKILCGILAATVITVSAMPVFAGGISAEEQTIMNNLSQTVTPKGGKPTTLPSGYLNQASNYLMENDLTAAEVASVNAQINSAVEVIKTEGITEASKAKVMGFANKAADVIGVTLTVAADGTVTVTAKSTGGTKKPATVATNAPVIKATGAAVDGTNAVVAMTALAGILAVAGYTISKNKLMDR